MIRNVTLKIIFLVFGLMVSGFSYASVNINNCTTICSIGYRLDSDPPTSGCFTNQNYNYFTETFSFDFPPSGGPRRRITKYNCPESEINCEAPSVWNKETLTCSTPSSSAPSSCPDGQVKNIVTGECEAMTQCTYPQLYNTLDNSCRPNESNCAINTVPIPFSDACNVIATPQCPSGWILSDVTGAHCLPDPDAPPTSSAPSEDGSSSSPSDSSSAPSSSPPASSSPSASSAPSSIGQTSSSGNGGDGDGSGGNSGGDGDGGGSNSSSNGGGNGDGSGSGDTEHADFDPNKMPSLSDAKDFGESLSEFGNRIKASSIGSGFTTFFRVNVNGACPVWTTNINIFSSSFPIVIDHLCSPIIPWGIISSILLFISTIYAARIGFGGSR